MNDHERAIQIIKEAGLRAKAYFVMGLPGETDETLQQNKDFVKKTQIDKWTISTFMPYPGCPVDLRRRDHGARRTTAAVRFTSFGINLAIARFGTASAFIFSPVLISAQTGWTTAAWFGAVLVLASLLGFITYTMFDAKFDRQVKEKLPEDKSDEFKFSDVIALFKNPSFIFITLLCCLFNFRLFLLWE